MNQENLMEASLDNGQTWFKVPTPQPDGYFPSYTHLENSYNDSIGNVHRDFLWKNRAKVECSYSSLTGSAYAILQDLYDAEEFLLKFTDNKGRRVTKIMYSGPIKGQAYRKDKTTNIVTIWTKISVNFIEKRR